MAPAMDWWSRRKGPRTDAPEDSAPAVESPQPDEPAIPLKDRALSWMNRYLAFNVRPGAAETEREVVPDVTAAAPAPRAAKRPATASAAGPAGRFARAIPSFDVGDRIAEVYEVRRIVTRGDLHTVYVAHHQHWDVDLIVKVPNPELVAVPGALRQLAARPERWATLGMHPNIVSCYHVHWLEGVPLAIIEYVDGGNLREWMEQGRCADLRFGLDLAIRICRGLEHAHRRETLHGALKPENILVTSQGMAKLADFGTPAVARGEPAAGGTRTRANDFNNPLAVWGLMRGAAYVAPERWTSVGYVDAPVDVFALGACLYEMFCGRAPYQTTCGPRQESPEPAATAGTPRLPERLVTLLKRCVEWQPDARPRTVEEISQELADVYQDLFGERGAAVTDRTREADEWNNKAVSAFYIGNHADAEAAWDAALEADPGHLEATFNRGVARWNRGLHTDEDLVQQLETFPVARDERWKARYFLSLIHLERGDAKSAVTLLEQAMRDRSDDTELAAMLARAQAAAATQVPEPFAEHTEYVAAVCISADGHAVLSASHDATAALWAVPDGHRLRTFGGHTRPVSCAFLSADGRFALTGSDDRTMRLWNTESGLCQRVFEGGAGRISSACLSRDGNLLLWAGLQSSEDVERLTLQLWDVEKGRCLHSLDGHTSSVKAVALSPDGTLAVSASDDQTVRLWDVATGTCLQVLLGHKHFVSAVCFNSDGSMVLSGSWDQTLRLWDVDSGECVRTLQGHTALVTSVCLSADDRWALSGGWDCAVRLWDVVNGRCLRTFRGHTGLVTGVAVSTQGNWGVSGSWDSTVRLWPLPLESSALCKLRFSGGAREATLSFA
jgi:serine/threonine protein kinase